MDETQGLAKGSALPSQGAFLTANHQSFSLTQSPNISHAGPVQYSTDQRWTCRLTACYDSESVSTSLGQICSSLWCSSHAPSIKKTLFHYYAPQSILCNRIFFVTTTGLSNYSGFILRFQVIILEIFSVKSVFLPHFS